jgi:DNA end-binding protein Ku
LAEHNIDKVTGEFAPNKFEDRYENAMIELIRSKQAGLPALKEKAASRPANIVNLMGALRRSIDGGGEKSGAWASSKKVLEAAPKKQAKKATRG